MATLNQIPGTPKVWLVDGQAWIVYTYNFDFIKGELPVAWSISQADLKTAFGGKPITYDRILTGSQFDSIGAIDFGDAVGLHDFEHDPLTEWMHNFETEAKVRPWLNDPEVASVFLGAYLENRSPTDAEFENTEWWRTHNKAQRDWLLLSYSDPSTAAQMKSDAKLQIRDSLLAAGVSHPGGELVNFLADQLVQGNWSSTYLEAQIRKLSDPFAPGRVDKELKALLDGRKLDRTQDQEEKVKELYDMWLGPRYGRISNASLREWAGKLRNDPDAETKLVRQLQQKRMALFPNYTDPTVTYDDIAGLGRNDWMDTLGTVPDEVNDRRWVNYLRQGDLETMDNRLWRIGIDRGSERMKRQAVSDTLNAFGTIRTPQ
jgi:hypothetical protein